MRWWWWNDDAYHNRRKNSREEKQLDDANKQQSAFAEEQEKRTTEALATKNANDKRVQDAKNRCEIESLESTLQQTAEELEEAQQEYESVKAIADKNKEMSERMKDVGYDQLGKLNAKSGAFHAKIIAVQGTLKKIKKRGMPEDFETKDGPALVELCMQTEAARKMVKADYEYSMVILSHYCSVTIHDFEIVLPFARIISAVVLLPFFSSKFSTMGWNDDEIEHDNTMHDLKMAHNKKIQERAEKNIKARGEHERNKLDSDHNADTQNSQIVHG